MSDYDVLIVGGGPCGLMSSLLLARFGVTSLVIERHPDISVHPKAMGITRRTGEIYQQLGIYDRMLAANITTPEYALTVWSKNLNGELLGRTPLVEDAAEFTPCVRFHCPQPHTEAVLAREMRNYKGCDLWHYREVTSTVETVDGVALTCVDRKTKEQIRLTGKYLLAADGARSPIRESMGIGLDGPGDMGHFINTYFRANYGPRLKERKALLYTALGEDFASFFVAVNGEDLWLMHHFLQGEETPADYSDERMAGYIKYASGMPDVPVEIISQMPWVMSPKIAKHWRQGRRILVGDSAARLSPSGGVGMNTGLAGAHNLAWKLAAVIKGDAPDSLLDSYESERLEAAAFSSSNSNENSAELFSIIECGLKGEWDDAKEKIAHSRRAGTILGLDLGLRYKQGALVDDDSPPVTLDDPINEYLPSGRPGGRAPHLWLTEGQSTLDLFGRGFTLLTGSDGDGWRAALDDSSWPLQGVLATAMHRIEHPEFCKLYGIASDGAVLVRPDGYIAVRIPSLKDSAPGELVEAAKQARCGSAQ